MKRKNHIRTVYFVLLGLLITLLFAQASLAVSTRPIKHEQNNNKLLKRLGWVSAPENRYMCGGYYIEPQLNSEEKAVLSLKESKTTITAHEGTFVRGKTSVLSGGVVVTQPGRLLKADRAVLTPDRKTGKLKTIDLYGNVEMRELGKLVLGNAAHLEINKKSGDIEGVLYRVALTQNNLLESVQVPINRSQVQLIGLNAWGRAEKAMQIKPGLTEFHNATYTTCAPTKAAWKLHARKIKLNKKTGYGIARDVKLSVKGIPIFYTPYLSFPLDHRRKSGFLFPTFGYTNASGVQWGIPYYWNMAPNYDFTFTPIIYTKRGLLLKGLFHYLTPVSFGHFQVGFIPQDQAFKNFKKKAIDNETFKKQSGFNDLFNASNNRRMISWYNHSHSNHWDALFDVTQVSDDYYFQDFGAVPSLITTNQVLQQARVSYTSNYWNIAAQLQNYQTLHPVNRQEVNNIYGRLPQITFNAYAPQKLGNLDFYLHGEGVYFRRGINPSEIRLPPKGGRLDLEPGISAPFHWAWGYLTPAVQLQATQYLLQDYTNPGKLPLEEKRSDNINRILPTLSIRSGLYFDRDVTFGKTAYDQTLEPEMFYLYVPFRDQNKIPVFDSAVIPFTYDQMFRRNRFSGIDRIGDANQVTLALTTRFINQNSGQEKLRASIGQIYYFRNRRVTLCQTPDCTDQGIGAPSSSEDLSPLAGLLSYHFNPHWSANANVAVDLKTKKTIDGNFYFHYESTPQHIFNLGLNFIRNGDIIASETKRSSHNNLYQASTSFALPLTRRWSSVGFFNYNISHGHAQTLLVGLQYDTCCWAVRLAGGKTFTALDEKGKPTSHNSFYIQWVLKGLANVESGDISTLLAQNIGGYKDPFLRY